MVAPVRCVFPGLNLTSQFKLISDIFAYAQKHNKIDIDLWYEGLCLEASGVNDVLRLVADTNNISYDNVTIHNNCNLLTHFDAPFNENHFAQGRFSRILRQLTVTHDKNIKYKFSSFIGRPSWDRLLIASWMFKQESKVMSFNSGPRPFRNKMPGTCFDILSRRMIQNYNITDAVNLIKHLPIQIQQESELMGLSSITADDKADAILDLNKFYNKSFVDVVSETSISGKVFFPTEKIFRPILYKTPFVVCGSQHFLDNLHKFGFETFSDFLPEYYDSVKNDNNRMMTVLDTLEWINEISLDDLKQMHKKMQPILDHNYDVLQRIRKKDYGREIFNE